MAEKILQLHGEYYNLTKLTNKNKNQRVLKFREKMQTTMILWPKDTLSKMQLLAESKILTGVDREIADRDLNFLKA